MKAIDKELKDRASWEELELTDAGAKKLKKGNTLTFKKDEVVTHWKIMQKRKNKVWLKQIQLYTPEEVDALSDEERELLMYGNTKESSR
jgi:uncharacterized protein Smg (DUF494 family)